MSKFNMFAIGFGLGVVFASLTLNYIYVFNGFREINEEWADV